MERRDLEQRLKEIGRVEAPNSLDRRMGALFEAAVQGTTGQDLDQRLKRMRRVPVPENLDRRMSALFDEAGGNGQVHRPWRLPAWTAAAAGLVLVISFLLRGGLGPEPVVVEIKPDGHLEQFLLGGEPATSTADLGIFTRGGCLVETVWPADAPDLNRQSINDHTPNGDHP